MLNVASAEATQFLMPSRYRDKTKVRTPNHEMVSGTICWTKLPTT